MRFAYATARRIFILSVAAALNDVPMTAFCEPALQNLSTQNWCQRQALSNAGIFYLPTSFHRGISSSVVASVKLPIKVAALPINLDQITNELLHQFVDHASGVAPAIPKVRVMSLPQLALRMKILLLNVKRNPPHSLLLSTLPAFWAQWEQSLSYGYVTYKRNRQSLRAYKATGPYAFTLPSDVARHPWRVYAFAALAPHHPRQLDAIQLFFQDDASFLRLGLQLLGVPHFYALAAAAWIDGVYDSKFDVLIPRSALNDFEIFTENELRNYIDGAPARQQKLRAGPYVQPDLDYLIKLEYALLARAIDHLQRRMEDCALRAINQKFQNVLIVSLNNAPRPWEIRLQQLKQLPIGIDEESAKVVEHWTQRRATETHLSLPALKMHRWTQWTYADLERAGLDIHGVYDSAAVILWLNDLHNKFREHFARQFKLQVQRQSTSAFSMENLTFEDALDTPLRLHRPILVRFNKGRFSTTQPLTVIPPELALAMEFFSTDESQHHKEWPSLFAELLPLRLTECQATNESAQSLFDHYVRTGAKPLPQNEMILAATPFWTIEKLLMDVQTLTLTPEQIEDGMLRIQTLLHGDEPVPAKLFVSSNDVPMTPWPFTGHSFQATVTNTQNHRRHYTVTFHGHHIHVASADAVSKPVWEDISQNTVTIGSFQLDFELKYYPRTMIIRANGAGTLEIDYQKPVPRGEVSQDRTFSDRHLWLRRLLVSAA